MPGTVVSNYEDQPEGRAELAGFLQEAWPARSSDHGWALRLVHWWDANPWASISPHRGWVARAADRMVGFGGLIPGCYAYEGQRVPALLASSFHVQAEYPQSAMTMFRQQRLVREEHIVVHATAIPRLQQTLSKMGSQAETQITRRIYGMGPLRHLRGRWPMLGSDMQVITDLALARALAQPFRRADRLEKWHTLESLRWWCASPMREHRFLGAMDRAGTVTSFLLLTPRPVRCLPAWDVVEGFTTREDASELQALVGSLTRHPSLLPTTKCLLTIPAFDSDTAWSHTPSLLARRQTVCHHFLLPELLRQTPKLTVMAEGDLGL